MEAQNLYNNLCETFEFDKKTKMISYHIISEDPNIYKSILFQVCFLMMTGSTKFEKLEDLWFYKDLASPSEIKLFVGIIESLILRVKDKSINNKETDVSLVIEFFSRMDYEKFKIFVYLQSIYSSFNNDPKYIIFPLLYAITFHNTYIKEQIKNDFKSIIQQKNNLRQDIQFNFIDTKFLRYFNGLLLSEDKKADEIYEYLRNYGKNTSENMDVSFSDTFSYFAELKQIILKYEKIFNDVKTSLEKTNERSQQNNSNSGSQNVQKNNGISTKSNSSDEGNSQTSEIKNNLGDKKESNLPEKSESSIKQSDFKSSLIISGRMFFLYHLCSKVSSIMNNFIINNTFLDEYNQLLISNYDNRLLLNKISSSLVLLQNANIINIKRKLVESLYFAILEKYQEDIIIEGDYTPNKYHLIELKKIMEKIKEKNKFDENHNITEDIKKLDNLINQTIESKPGAKLIIKELKTKKQKQIDMVLNFLKFCKKTLNPYVHGDNDKINYYLLPRSLFDSNLKFAEYMFSLTDIIKKKESSEKEKESKSKDKKEYSDFYIYIKDKEISILEAMETLLSVNLADILTLGKNMLDNLNEKKINLKQELKEFKHSFNLFSKISIDDFDDGDNIIITEEIRKEESDIINKLENFNNLLSEILNDKMSRNDSENVINELKKTVQKEVQDSRNLIFNIENLGEELDYIKVKKAIISKINRMHLIKDFFRKQTEKFSELQRSLYQDYENNAKLILEKSEEIKKIKQEKYSLENENLFDKWIESEPSYKKENLNQPTLINNFKELIPTVNLNVNYNFDEKFVFWMIKNKFIQYLKF